MTVSKLCAAYALIACVLAACSRAPEAPPPNTPPMTDAESLAYRACKADSDCVYVQNGCCDCVNGGGALAVHRDQVEAFRATFQCPMTECTARGRIPGCHEGVPSCKLGRCQYTLAE